MELSTVRRIMESAIAELNKVEVSGYSLNGKWATTTHVRDHDEEDEVFSFGLYTEELKFGGIDDDDNNDALMQEELGNNLTRILAKNTTDLKVDYFCGDYKGSWYVKVIEVVSKAEKQKVTKKKKITLEIEKYKKELKDFKEKIKSRIVNQKSKKKTCSHCQSNVTTSYFTSHKCPVCSSNMYTETDQKRANNLIDRIEKRKQELRKIA